MTDHDPSVTLEFLAARLTEVEEQAARQATWTMVALVGVLAVALLLFAGARLDTARAQRQTAILLRVCSVGAARMAESRVAYCEQAVPGFRLARAPVAERAAAVDSLEVWAQSGSPGPWVPPTTTTLYPDPPQ